jgi:hypothetical protein
MNRVLQQVAGILATGDIEFIVADSGDTLFVPFDSAVLQVDGADDDHPRVEIVAWLVSELELDPAMERAIRERLNGLNAEWLFPRFCLVPDLASITLEYEFPAGDLKADDFREVLLHLASLAEDLDDELQGDFGGRRAMDHAVSATADLAERSAGSTDRIEPAEATSRLKKIFGR